MLLIIVILKQKQNVQQLPVKSIQTFLKVCKDVSLKQGKYDIIWWLTIACKWYIVCNVYLLDK